MKEVNAVREASFEHAAELIRILKSHGFSAYIVGGAVRDHLLGKEVDDIDIATSARPEEVADLFPKTIPVGVEHGTIIVRHHHHSYEVTTFRSESDYIDHRRPSSVIFVSSLKEDLQRRDFTINALAMTDNGEIADPFSGRHDLQKHLIRAVGKAEERFQEDPLRMMRAIRFVSQLCFDLEPITKKALEEMAANLRHISVERITIEFEKMLLGSCTQQALRFLIDSGLSQYLPGMSNRDEALMEFAKTHSTHLFSIEEKWALLTIQLQVQEPVKWLKQWKLSNDKIKQVLQIFKCTETIENRKWTSVFVYQAGLDKAISADKIRSLLDDLPSEQEDIERIYNELPIKNRKQLAINGNDLIEWFQQEPGPWISKRLEAAEKAVVEGVIENDKGEVRRWLLSQTY